MRLRPSPRFQEDVQEFQAAFCPDQNAESLGHPSSETVMLRAKLMIEELGETLVAMTQKDLVAIADGLADLLVVTFGTALAYGIDIGPVWQAVHKSNMAKLGPDGQPIRREDGKVLKPADWQPPNIKEALIPSGFYDPRYHEPGA